ncbi:unnamed protein product [Camellia sinensis]
MKSTKKREREMSNKNLETRTLLGEIRNFDKGSVFFYLGHPLLNRIAHCFIKAAGIGAIQAVPHEAYFTALEGDGVGNRPCATRDHDRQEEVLIPRPQS